MNEVWKSIENYENIYEVSNLGNVRNILLKQDMAKIDTKTRYLKVSLSKDGQQKHFSIHRLVAKAFIENPNNYDVVNHKDSNYLNNCAENLEWCTNQYNVDYSKAVPVAEYSLNNKLKKIYKSRAEASRFTGVSQGNISQCCNGNRETAGGSKWVSLDFTLASIYSMQHKLQNRLGTLNFSSEAERTKFIMTNALHTMHELHEMLAELEFFKDWKKYNWSNAKSKCQLDKAREEFIDAFHFLLNILYGQMFCCLVLWDLALSHLFR